MLEHYEEVMCFSGCIIPRLNLLKARVRHTRPLFMVSGAVINIELQLRKPTLTSCFLAHVFSFKYTKNAQLPKRFKLFFFLAMRTRMINVNGNKGKRWAICINNLQEILHWFDVKYILLLKTIFEITEQDPSPLKELCALIKEVVYLEVDKRRFL